MTATPPAVKPARLRAVPLLAALLLAACAGRPPAPEWQANAHDAAERATRAHLSGDERVAGQEWKRARAEVARTGSPALLARLELMRCAAQVASLEAEGSGCPAFQALRVDAEPPERAYADYLQGRVDAARVALLPEPQRAAAVNPAAIAAIEDPTARLVAAGAALQAGRATPEILVVATDTASGQGWRRPLLAWLLVRVERAAALGEEELAQALRRRIAVVQGGGAPARPDSPAR
ncbi:hypothetical protein [Melaminivora sp.]|uniref:hypothetical protein n=1 Tax=Melaminivora sp. TaxID=1933032 RepID=UPI0028AA5718|nr:hypothetical protein [Melaminivora sp.]